MIMINELIICIGIGLTNMSAVGLPLYTIFSDIEKTYNRITFPMMLFLLLFIFGIILIFVGCFI